MRHLAAHGCRLAWQRHRLAGVDQLVTLDTQDADVLVDVVADVEVATVGAEHRAFGQAAHDEYAERMSEYYAGITPLTDFRPYGSEDW